MCSVWVRFRRLRDPRSHPLLLCRRLQQHRSERVIEQGCEQCDAVVERSCAVVDEHVCAVSHSEPFARPGVCAPDAPLPLDVVFVLDGSGSTGAVTYERLVDLSADFVELVGASASGVRFAGCCDQEHAEHCV